MVTGGAGFIGSHVCEALLKKGYDVVIVDDFNDYYDPANKERNCDTIRETAVSLDRPDSLVICRGDILDKDFLNSVFEKYNFKAVLHLAACTGVRSSITEAVKFLNVNLNGTVNILECMRDHGVKKHIFASSSSVYGKNKVPFSEYDPADSPISPYAVSKRAAELICSTYLHLNGISTVCLRFFTVYGPRQRPDLAIRKFTSLISEGKSIPVFGDGNTRRDYTYVDDTVNGVVHALEWVLNQDRCFEIFNLGESETISLTEMIESIARHLDKKPIIERLPKQPGDMDVTNADISKARAVLGYSPKVDFDKGMKRYIEWYKSEFGI